MWRIRTDARRLSNSFWVLASIVTIIGVIALAGADDLVAGLILLVGVLSPCSCSCSRRR